LEVLYKKFGPILSKIDLNKDENEISTILSDYYLNWIIIIWNYYFNFLIYIFRTLQENNNKKNIFCFLKRKKYKIFCFCYLQNTNNKII
jgi:hypothetical protein